MSENNEAAPRPTVFWKQEDDGSLVMWSDQNDRRAVVRARDNHTMLVERSDGVRMGGDVSPYFARRYAVKYVLGATSR